MYCTFDAACISRSALRKVGKTWQACQNEITLDITRFQTVYMLINYYYWCFRNALRSGKWRKIDLCGCV